jgi:prophage regulatory protein
MTDDSKPLRCRSEALRGDSRGILLALVEDLPERALTRKEVEEMLGVSTATFWRRRRSGEFPIRPIMLSKACPRYLQSEVLAWLRSRPRG